MTLLKAVEDFLQSASGWVWGVPLVALLFGTHLYLTVRLRFVQRYMGKAIRLSVQRDEGAQGDISQFGALATALAATIGTGNIVGVATAIASGGPGAVLWMWLTGVFGIATKYSEAVLAVKYRVRTESGAMAGGPMYVLERGLGKRWLGLLFAGLTAVAAFGIGCGVQANAIANLVHDKFDVPHWATGLVLATLTAVVILGGVRSIARVCETLVPFMALFYVVGCLVLLVTGWRTIPHALATILEGAFSGQAAVGGFLGAGMKEAIRYGIARGLFSNESGLGSAPIVAAAAQTRNAVRQALVSASGTFWDTVVVCAMTGLVIVNTGDWQKGLTGSVLTRTAFDEFPTIGPLVLNVALATFVFSTILGWSYYGEKAIEYLFGSRAILPYRIAWVVVVFVGARSSLDAVWNFADVANGLMAVPNLVSLLLLSGVVVRETRAHLWEGDPDGEG